jgi:hypothetical protein
LRWLKNPTPKSFKRGSRIEEKKKEKWKGIPPF